MVSGLCVSWYTCGQAGIKKGWHLLYIYLVSSKNISHVLQLNESDVAVQGSCRDS